MSYEGRKALILLGLGLLLMLSGVGVALADDEKSRQEWHGQMSRIVVDEDGNRHEKTIELDGPPPFLGVGLERVRDGSGARIDSIVGDSPAERAGLREGDVVVRYDGTEIETPWDLTDAVLQSKSGDRVEIEVLRDGNRETVTAELAERDDRVGGFSLGDMDFSFDSDMLREHMDRLHDMDFSFDMEALEEQMERLGERLGNMNFDFHFDDHGGHGLAFRSARPRLGVQLVDVTDELREHLGSRPDEGLLVGKVLADTPAQEAGVEVGDLIVAIDGEPIARVGDLRRLLRERDGETFGIEVIRDGSPLSLTVSLPEREADEVEEAEPGHHRRKLQPEVGTGRNST